MSQQILLISPPFTQLNTPYPATAYIKGFLNTRGIMSKQLDLGIETILKIFTPDILKNVFKGATNSIYLASANVQRIFKLQDEYINTIESVIKFLQDEDQTLSHLICSRQFLPEASKFEDLKDLEWAFGTMGTHDEAKHIASLYLEDLGDFITECIDPHFGFSRYAERLGLSANSFDDLYLELQKADTLIIKTMISLLQENILKSTPNLICLSVPFPGNLFTALKCGQWIKANYPEIKIVMGGGYPNTELRSLSEKRVFEFIDYICLDDGEAPLLILLDYLDGKIDETMLKRTFLLSADDVVYMNGSLLPDIKQENTGVPDYSGLPLKYYLSFIQITNPMHRLWSDGRWNKLTMAHGCYWRKCSFCDISLDYIKNYEASSASLIVDRMETLIEQTGERGFHFVDEAAPPALMKSVALEILKRKLVVSWWTNIRFEKSFHLDLCKLLAASGCIAVSGGLEVASDRLLKLIAKGVTVEQVAQVTENFNQAGIMIHAYLMYGFPTQTAQETIDSLEIVRQMFAENILQSAFWHRFAMTAHSPVGLHPKTFNVVNLSPDIAAFANNDLIHEDPQGAEHDLFKDGLVKSLYNFMHGLCLEDPLQNWFSHKTPETSLAPELISGYIKNKPFRKIKDLHNLLWIGGPVSYDSEQQRLSIIGKQQSFHLKCSKSEGIWLAQMLSLMNVENLPYQTYQTFRNSYQKHELPDFTLFWYGQIMDLIREIGLIIIN